MPSTRASLLSLLVDAGAAAVGTIQRSAPPPGAAAAFDWLHAGAGPGAVVTAIVVIFGWWMSKRLERFKNALAGDQASNTERLRGS